MPDFSRTSPPSQGMGPFIMNPEGVARLFAVDKMAEGHGHRCSDACGTWSDLG